MTKDLFSLRRLSQSFQKTKRSKRKKSRSRRIKTMRPWSTSLRWKSSRRDNQNSQCLRSKECNHTDLDRLSHLIREALWNLVTVATRNSRLIWWRVALRLRLILILPDLSIRSIPEMLSHLDLSKVLRDRQTTRKIKLTFWSNCRLNKTKEWGTSSNWMTLTSISSIMSALRRILTLSHLCLNV